MRLTEEQKAYVYVTVKKSFKTMPMVRADEIARQVASELHTNYEDILRHLEISVAGNEYKALGTAFPGGLQCIYLINPEAVLVLSGGKYVVENKTETLMLLSPVLDLREKS